MAIVKNLNSKLIERVVATERQCWENAQYSRRDTPEVVGIPMSVRENVVEQKVCDVLQEIGVDKCDRDIQACHRLKDKDRTIVKFTNRKDCLRILRVKRKLRGLDPSAVDLPEGTKFFVNESLGPYYRGIWNKCKKIKGQTKCTSILYNEWFSSFTNWGIWSSKNYYSYGWPMRSIVCSSMFFPDICWWSSCCVLLFGKFCYFLSYISTLFFCFTFCAILDF